MAGRVCDATLPACEVGMAPAGVYGAATGVRVDAEIVMYIVPVSSIGVRSREVLCIRDCCV